MIMNYTTDKSSSSYKSIQGMMALNGMEWSGNHGMTLFGKHKSEVVFFFKYVGEDEGEGYSI